MAITEVRNKAEAEIRQVMDRYYEAVQAKDINGLRAVYAPEVMAFDMMPPLRYQGANDYLKLWQECLSCGAEMSFSTKDMKISVGEDIGFCHYLCNCKGQMPEKDNPSVKKDFSSWFRATVCFQKINGQWLIVHEHTSVPVDMESEKALVDLTP